MLYSFDFAAQVTRLCMDEIRRRGMQERKILRKSAPSSVLFLKVFREQSCGPEDLRHVSIHSVATLMQDTLWCSQERIVPKTVWRIINYETCTLSNLSRFLSRKKEELLIEILDFLVELMQHKEKNLMDAYHLGEAMGKVTLGPTDCDPIIAEKANHFLTRMIIEHSKRLHSQHKRHSVSRPDSGFVQSPKQQQQQQQKLKFSSIDLCNESAYYELRPMSKTEAARAKAKSYDRHIRKIRTSSSDWVANTVGIRAMLDDDYEPEQVEPQEPWIPIFTTQLDQYDPIASPLIYRIVSEASKPKLPIPVDPFASSYLFRKNNVVEAQVSHAFSEFASLCTITYDISDKTGKQTNVSHLKKINHSLSNMKLNLRKHRSQAALESQFSNDETLREEDEDAVSADQQRKPIKQQQQQHHHVKNMMRRVIRMSALPANNKHAAPQPMS